MTALFTRPRSVARVGPWISTFLAALTVTCFLEGGMATALQDAKPKKKSFPTVYALVLVAREPPRILQEQPARMNREDFADHVDLQVALLKSPLVLKAALSAEEVTKVETVKQQKDPTAWLAGRLQVDADKRTGILRVAVSGGEPEEQAVLANAVADAFVVEIGQKEGRLKQNRMDQLKKFYAEHDAMLRDKRAVLKRMSVALGADGGKLLDLKRQFARKQLEAVEKELLAVQAQIRKTRIEITLAKARAQEIPTDSPLSAAVIEQAIQISPGAAPLIDDIRQLEMAVATLKKTSPDPKKEPAHQKATARLESAKKELHEKLRADLEATQQAAHRRIGQLSNVDAFLNSEWNDHVRVIEGASKEMVDLDWLQDEIRQMDTLMQEVTKQMHLLQVELQAAPRITILERAKAPGR